MKIKITEKVKEFDGEIIQKGVTLFGTSAHIPFSKKHTGKIVNVIVPTKAEYVWILSKEVLEDLTKTCLNTLKNQEETKLTFHEIRRIKNLSDKTFSLEDLQTAYELCKIDKPRLALNLKLIYNL